MPGERAGDIVAITGGEFAAALTGQRRHVQRACGPIGGTCTVRLRFGPASLGAVTGALTVESNAAGAAPVVALSGTGTTPLAGPEGPAGPAGATGPAGAAGPRCDLGLPVRRTARRDRARGRHRQHGTGWTSRPGGA